MLLYNIYIYIYPNLFVAVSYVSSYKCLTVSKEFWVYVQWSSYKVTWFIVDLPLATERLYFTSASRPLLHTHPRSQAAATCLLRPQYQLLRSLLVSYHDHAYKNRFIRSPHTPKTSTVYIHASRETPQRRSSQNMTCLSSSCHCKTHTSIAFCT